MPPPVRAITARRNAYGRRRRSIRRDLRARIARPEPPRPGPSTDRCKPRRAVPLRLRPRTTPVRQRHSIRHATLHRPDPAVQRRPGRNSFYSSAPAAAILVATNTRSRLESPPRPAPISAPGTHPAIPANLATDPPPVISPPNPDAAPVPGIAEVNNRGLRVASRPGMKMPRPMAPCPRRPVRGPSCHALPTYSLSAGWRARRPRPLLVHRACLPHCPCGFVERRLGCHSLRDPSTIRTDLSTSAQLRPHSRVPPILGDRVR